MQRTRERNLGCVVGVRCEVGREKVQEKKEGGEWREEWWDAGVVCGIISRRGCAVWIIFLEGKNRRNRAGDAVGATTVCSKGVAVVYFF